MGGLLGLSILLAGMLLAGCLYLLATPAVTGHAPTPFRAIPEDRFQTVWEAPGTSFVLVVTPEPALLPTARPRANPKVEVPKPVVAPKHTPASKPADAALDHRLQGRASWYCRAGVSICHYQYPDTTGFDAYAAAGPALRKAIGPGWRNSVVTVNGVRVRLVDWCKCTGGSVGVEKAIDLYYDVFGRVGSTVTIRW